jgi:hypothetical protein
MEQSSHVETVVLMSREISLKALDFRAFAGSEEKQLRGAESSVETYPKLSSNKP